MEKKEIKKLIAAAMKAREKAYAPYSKFSVGAAILCDDGTMYTGCNVENASYPAGLCAERNALGSAVADGKRNFKGIAIVGSGDDFTTPCGICRQVLAEFHVPLAISAKNEKEYELFDMTDLLPHAFEF